MAGWRDSEMYSQLETMKCTIECEAYGWKHTITLKGLQLDVKAYGLLKAEVLGFLELLITSWWHWA